ncbi:hypothetical protein MNBD_BACTEROID06-571, partial [hydrothermal vent metagenome]
FIGDEINLLMAASAFNLKKWMNIYFYALFSRDYALVVEALAQLEQEMQQYWMLFFMKSVLKN